MQARQIKSLIRSLFQVVKDRSTDQELTFICPLCKDSTGNRSVNLHTGQTNCWRCGKGGKLIPWLRSNGFEVDESGFAAAEEIDMDQIIRDGQDAKKLFMPVASQVDLPKGFIKLTDYPDSVYVKWIEKMAIRKNLSLEAFMEAGAGFTKEGRWEPFCIFPSFEYDRPVYYQGRTYVDVPDEPTKLFPSRNELPYGAKYWIYGIDACLDPKVHSVVVVESILNVLSLREALLDLGIEELVPVCIFKHALSKMQALKLRRYKNIKNVYMLFDADSNEAAVDNCDRFNGMWDMYPVEMPGTLENPTQDANDDVDAALQAISEAKRFSGSSQVVTMQIEKTRKEMRERSLSNVKPLGS